MFEFLGFGRARKAQTEIPKPTVGIDPDSVKSGRHRKQRELIRLALNNVLRRHGIALQWIGCEFASMGRAGADDVMLVQLVILKWHDGLMRYAPDLQSELLNEIHLSDSSMAASDLLFVWKFAPDCGYIGGKLPAPEFWASTTSAQSTVQGLAAAPAIAAATPAGPAVKFDLPRSTLDDDDNDDGFAATQIVSR